MTGAMGRSIVTAALFAVHPLNIESVVWIAERKNLLGAFFWFLTILTYVTYTKQRSRMRYLAVLTCFSLGLMAKPVLVTLPFVLLLLDYWPLERFSLRARGTAGMIPEAGRERKIVLRLLAEKIPLMILALLSALMTFHAAQTGGAVKSLSVYPLIGRIANAFTSYGLYLVKMVWPSGLAIFYPYPRGWSGWQVAAAILFFLSATGFFVLKGRRSRYLLVGWLWYVITLVPVIGIVQVGYQSMANRYTYLSLVGIFIMIAWGVPDLIKNAAGRRFLPVAAGLMILLLAFSTRAQLPHWRNSEAVFRQALKVTENNHIAQFGMGNVWFTRGDLAKAQRSYEETLRIKPDYAEAHNNLALTLMGMGRSDEAEVQYLAALRANPHYAEAYNNLGVALADQRKFPEAEIAFRRAVALKRDYAEAHNNLNLLLMDRGRIDEAIRGFSSLLNTMPDNAAAKGNLAVALKRKQAALERSKAGNE
jgi:Tfp pilus assembly protein PilF